VLIAELRPRTVFEIGSGSGASAAWFANLLALSYATQFAHSSMRIPETISSIRASPTTSDETQPARLIQSL
jgi:cephalosporin hydroxylase